MADNTKKAFAGSISVPAGSASHTDAEHVVRRSLTFAYHDADVPLDGEHLVHVAQTGMTLQSARLVPAITQGAQATNYVSVALAKGDLAAGAYTTFDTITSETAMTQQTARSFTIVPSTDTLADGDGLYCVITHNGTTTGAIAFTLIVDYTLTA